MTKVRVENCVNPVPCSEIQKVKSHLCSWPLQKETSPRQPYFRKRAQHLYSGKNKADSRHPTWIRQILVQAHLGVRVIWLAFWLFTGCEMKKMNIRERIDSPVSIQSQFQSNCIPSKCRWMRSTSTTIIFLDFRRFWDLCLPNFSSSESGTDCCVVLFSSCRFLKPSSILTAFF